LRALRAAIKRHHENESIASRMSTTAAKYRALLWGWAGSISTKLSIALVLGLALVPLARVSTPAATAVVTQRLPDRKAETVHVTKPEPVVTGGLKVSPGSGQLSTAEAEESLLQLAAARRRTKQSKREEPEPKRTASAIATEQTERKSSAIASADPGGKVPIPSGETKSETQETEAPKPDIWSDAEVITALKECVRLLAPISADIEVAPPLKKEECGTPAPVMVRRVGKVEINPPAMVNCAMVASLYSWVDKTLQPIALEVFGSPIARLRNASGYSCRNRNGSAHNSDKLSEHAKANAIDIGGFSTADGRAIDVARFWGPTARDIREAERLAAVRAQERKEPAKEIKAEPAKAVPHRSVSAIATHQEGRPDRGQRRGVAMTELQRSGEDRSATDAKSVPLLSNGGGGGEVKASTTVEATFLRRLHKGACGTFGTVLGPEANEAHRDHFHFDLTPRKRSAFCE
jgi:hypothetical protein